MRRYLSLSALSFSTTTPLKKRKPSRPDHMSFLIPSVMGSNNSPTRPNKAVNMISRYLLAKLLKEPIHPGSFAAAAVVGQILSIWKEGDVLLRYPQQLNYKSKRYSSLKTFRILVVVTCFVPAEFVGSTTVQGLTESLRSSTR